jgi:hypothetical protein
MKILSYFLIAWAVSMFFALVAGVYYVILTPGNPASDDRMVSVNCMNFVMCMIAGFAGGVLFAYEKEHRAS